jgi:hypothetical protein
MRDQPDAETYTLQHTTLARDRHPCPRRDSNPPIPAREWRQTHILDRAATGIGYSYIYVHYMKVGADKLVVHCTRVVQSKISPWINVLPDTIYSDLLLEKRSFFCFCISDTF